MASKARQPVARPLVRVLRLLHKGVRGAKEELGIRGVRLQQCGAARLVEERRVELAVHGVRLIYGVDACSELEFNVIKAGDVDLLHFPQVGDEQAVEIRGVEVGHMGAHEIQRLPHCQVRGAIEKALQREIERGGVGAADVERNGHGLQKALDLSPAVCKTLRGWGCYFAEVSDAPLQPNSSSSVRYTGSQLTRDMNACMRGEAGGQVLRILLAQLR